MSDEERARAFNRFWQSAGARRDGRPNGHFGLGLSIVRELVVGDGGEIALVPSASGGLEVIVRMRRRDVPPPRPARQLSTASATT
jgi:signal transduction histidine kinase